MMMLIMMMMMAMIMTMTTVPRQLLMMTRIPVEGCQGKRIKRVVDTMIPLVTENTLVL